MKIINAIIQNTQISDKSITAFCLQNYNFFNIKFKTNENFRFSFKTSMV